MKSDIDNNQMLEVGIYPRTLVEAFTITVKYKMNSARQMTTSTSSSAAFVTQSRGKSGEPKKSAV